MTERKVKLIQRMLRLGDEETDFVDKERKMQE